MATDDVVRAGAGCEDAACGDAGRRAGADPLEAVCPGVPPGAIAGDGGDQDAAGVAGGDAGGGAWAGAGADAARGGDAVGLGVAA